MISCLFIYFFTISKSISLNENIQVHCKRWISHYIIYSLFSHCLCFLIYLLRKCHHSISVFNNKCSCLVYIDSICRIMITKDRHIYSTIIDRTTLYILSSYVFLLEHMMYICSIFSVILFSFFIRN
jgi:hypothetical protein